MSNLTHDHKHKIAYAYYVENTPIITIAKRFNLCSKTVNKWLKELISDIGLTKTYLPESYYKTHTNYKTKNKFKGYYDCIPEMQIGETPDYSKLHYLSVFNEGRIVSSEQVERRLFHERYNYYKEQIVDSPILMQRIINEKILYLKNN